MIPEYNELAKAVDVFDDVYFYGDEESRKGCSQRRQDVLGNMTVKEVYLKFTEGRNDIEKGLMALCIAIKADEPPVLRYFEGVEMKAEDVLDNMKIIALTSPKDVDIFKNIHVQPLPVTEFIYHAAISTPNRRKELSRAHNLALVLGSSGSGKTFFALHQLAPNFQRNQETHERAVTLHINPSETRIQFMKDEEENTQAAADLCSWIKVTLSEKAKKEIKDKLKMHICIIFDEAGAQKVRPWFENIDMLKSLCNHVASIAESVSVVVSGTALFGNHVDSKDDAYVFRMKLWTAMDLGMILETKATLLSAIKAKETPVSLAQAIMSHPKVGALATNGRSAYFVCDAMTRLSLQYKGIIWTLQLDVWATNLVTSVVEGYVGSNGLKNLEPTRRRRVAASIFRALQDCKMNEATLPTFVALEDGEMAVAYSLVQSNIEFSNAKLKLVKGEKFAITITPAIAIVMYTIAGIPTTLLPGWSAEEEIAALYAVRQLILASMETYVKEVSFDERQLKVINQTPANVRSLAKDKLNESLENIQLLALHSHTRSKPQSDEVGKILIPLVGASTVWVSGDMMPFADVIAPYMLIQAKRQTTSNTKNKPIDMQAELKKCSLLKSCEENGDDRQLRGLVALWKGKLDAKIDARKKVKSKQEPDGGFQSSAAFPENMLCFKPSIDPCRYAVVDGQKIIMGKRKRVLPPLDGATIITFLLCINADTIKLKLSPQKIITITQANLDKDLRIDPDTFLRDADRTKWTNFVRDGVRDIVDIKFLLTKSA